MSTTARRVVRYAAAGTAVTVGGVSLILFPPKEVLPSSVLPARVLLEGLGRVGRCAVVGGQIFTDYTFHVNAHDSQEAWNIVHTRCAHRLVDLAETNGGLYVKAGQIFANMSHVLPIQYCTVMSVLQDAVIKRPFGEIVAVLETDLGKPVEEVFSWIDHNPMAAASLAQVHRAHLKKEDIDVAVKVQYIDIAHRFKGDMRTIDAMLKIAGSLYKGFNFGEIVKKLNNTVEAELDFRLEAGNSDEAARDLRKGGFGDNVVCPNIYWDYVQKRILVSRLITNAVKISDRHGMEDRGINPHKAAQWFFDAIAYQMFVTGFFHGDPHAGNVLVHKLPNGKDQVVLLDFGLCERLDKKERREISDIWTASVTHDTELVKTLAARYHCEDYGLFASCFLQHPYEYFSALKKNQLDSSVQQSIRDTAKHQMLEINGIVSSLPHQYALILRSMMATKAINRELGEAANRPMRFLRSSMKTSCSDLPFWKANWLMLKAYSAEWYADLMMRIAIWRHPELKEVLETYAAG